MLVGAGANDIGGINFTVTQASKLLDEAREKAIADARRKAEIYAKAAGVTLGAPLSISEEGAPVPAVPRQDGRADGRRRAGRARRRDAVGDGERVLGDQAGAVDCLVVPRMRGPHPRGARQLAAASRKMDSGHGFGSALAAPRVRDDDDV